MAKKSISSMTPSALNRAIESIDKKRSKATDKLIAAGFGNVKFSALRKSSNPLAKAYIKLQDERNEISYEIAKRFGPGMRRAPTRNPTRKKRTKKRAKKKVTRRKNPHSLYWTIFACKGKSVQWFKLTERGKLFATGDKSKSILFKSANEASKVAAGIKGARGWKIGVTNYSITSAQIATHCKKGKA